MASFDSQIDALYQKPLDEFTPARNALAKTLTGADAARVRKLPKPTVVPWAVNQLYWRTRPIFDRLRDAGERVRAAQIAALKGRSADVRGAVDAQRKAVAAAVQQAIALAGEAGSHPSPDELTRTLEALSLAPNLPETEGRWTRALQPAGFEALAGVDPTAIRARPIAKPESRAKTKGPADTRSPAAGGHAVQSATRPADRTDAERRAREADARRAEAEVHRAEAALDRTKAAEAQARAAWERLKDQVQAAERTLADARKAFKR